MNIKPIVSSISHKNIADFLGEPNDTVSKGLDLSLESFIEIIKKFVGTPTGSADLLHILNQGGHTGDVVQNLSDLTTKPEKIQLLIKIGSNIVQHFAGDNIGDIINGISNTSGARKTSSNSLLNLAGPLVLGQIGKFKNDMTLNEDGLKKLLLGTSGSPVIEFTPPPPVQTYVAPVPVANLTPEVENTPFLFNTNPVAEASPSQQVTPKVPNTKPKNVAWKYIVPWTILGIACIFPFVKNGFDFKKIFNFTPTKTEIAKDSILTSSPSDFLPETKVNSSPKIEPEEPLEPIETEPVNAALPKSEKPAKVEKAFETSKPKENSKTTKIEDPKKEADKPRKENRPESTESEPKESGKETSKLPGGYSPISASIFGRNNAEIRNGSSLNQYISKTVVISPTSNSNLAEDRAYAVREYLMEKGNQNVTVSKKINGSTSSLVAVLVP